MPRPCQTVLQTGEPCRREAVPDSDYCEICASALSRGHAGDSRLYNLSVGQSRADEFSKHNDATNLFNELALARLLFERKYNGIASEGPEALKINAGPLMDLLRKITDLAVQGDALARKRGELLDRGRVTNLAEKLIMCVTEVVEDKIGDETLQGELLTDIGTAFQDILKKELQC